MEISVLAVVSCPKYMKENQRGPRADQIGDDICDRPGSPGVHEMLSDLYRDTKRCKADPLQI